MSVHEPVRTCVGCRKRRPQVELVRLYMDEHGQVLPGRSGPGRGAWLCADTTGVCLVLAADRKAFDRAFKKKPDRASVDRLGERWPRSDNRV